MDKESNKAMTQLALRIAVLVSSKRSRRCRRVVLDAVHHALQQQVQLQREQSRLVKAFQRGWLLAAHRIIADGRYEREAMPRVHAAYCQALGEFEESVNHSLGAGPLLSELQELAGEFGPPCWNDDWLWITTEPVVLEGVALGRFEVRLRLDRIGNPTDGDDFEIPALDPNPAASAEEVTHPHVSAGVLCQGDAAAPIRLALEQGRLVDCFQIVRSTLMTYNPHSAHVKLDQWCGVCCYECNASVHSDNACYCEGCDHDFCEECCNCCCECESVRCGECLTGCRHCGDSFCSECLVACEACEVRSFCDSCLEEGLCPSCHDEQSQEKDNEATTEQDGKAGGAVHETSRPPDVPAKQATHSDAGVHPISMDQAPVFLPCRSD